ncbi:pilus assembly protein PilW [Pseudomonas entomophila]|uniref:PilW family protein n=1 Tax=Pseudomonas entomophila TaxID=312306 RepID=UPI002405A0C4|nr:pilus assembly protein PilW [Pseudomonas entomophila]MDF9618546.1 pilus assembly protein PilW [Pseudomonas entomophila]
MRRRQDGLGLIEALLALALGLLLLAVAGQLFGSAHQAWQLQGVKARLQDDARLVLQRLSEDVRMAGMFGCLRLDPEDFADPHTARAFARPIEITGDSLTLVGAELPGVLGVADWTVLTDCRTWARVEAGPHAAGPQVLAIPIRRVGYRLRNGSLMLTTNAQHVSLIDNVRAFEVSEVEAGEGLRVDIRLILHDRRHRLEQRHEMSVAVRNPWSGA